MLVTDDVNGQNRSAVAAVRALARRGFRTAVTTCTHRSVAAASRHCLRRVEVPAAGSPGYAHALRNEVERGDYLAVFPASDAALVALDAPGAPLVDKEVLAHRVAAAGLRTVPGRVFDSVADLRVSAASGSVELSYPWVVKSALKSGAGAMQARRVESLAHLARLGAERGPVMVQPVIDGELRAVAGVVWDGRLLAVSHQRYHRLWPPRAGVGSAASTVEADLELEAGLVRLLAGHRGVFQVQLIGGHVLDVNPRVFGSLPLAVAAGANLPAVTAEAARGRFTSLVRARVGVRYRWLEGDLRSLAAGLRAGDLSCREVARELRPVRGTAHSIESVRDPLPSLIRLAVVARSGGRHDLP